MLSEKQPTPFYDMKKQAIVKGGSFFLESILKARTDLHMETGSHKYDEELNVYLAGLLNLLGRSDSFLRLKPYISPFDVDVQKWLETHPGLRNAFVVYRDNADFGLMLLGLFCGYQHPGSYHKIVIGDKDKKEGRVALYYEMAASALTHLHGHQGSLIDVFQARFPEGSLFHLEGEMIAAAERKKNDAKLDEFLRCYAAYKEHPSDETKNKLLSLVDELKRVNPDFKFGDKLDLNSPV
jgi:hypothetical protein